MDGNSLVVGLLGGIAAGKSKVAGMLVALGARSIDADRLAHEILEDPGFRPPLRELLGPDAVAEDGPIDRARVADRVFSDPALLEGLEEALHPRVVARIREEMDACGVKRPTMIVIDAPLLLEAGLEDLVDCLVYVESPEEARRARSRRDRGWAEDEIARRERCQVTLAEKRRRADIVIVNDGTVEELEQRVAGLHRRLLATRDPE